jgi:micrococcal nuclease
MPGSASGRPARVESTCPWTVEPVPLAQPDPEPPAKGNCHPSYDPCVPNVDHDLDCIAIGFQVAVIGPEKYRLDGED